MDEDSIVSDADYQTLNLSSEDVAVVVPGGDFHKVYLKPTQTAAIKKKYSKGPRRPQPKKELYLKLDEILFDALRQEFEVCPGYTIDRLYMVKFLTSVVQRHLSDFPDLDNLLNLRDTVLTGRIKKVFPEVEYKRRQVKEDQYRKAWLYVNIRRKPSRTTHHDEVKIESVSTTSTWTPPVASGNVSRKRASPAPLSSSSAGAGHHQSSPAYTSATLERCSPNTMVVDSSGVGLYGGESPGCDSGSDGMALDVSTHFNVECEGSERSALVMDSSNLQEWVVSSYVQDSSWYVPVQDVVKAFKKDFNVDITYKECHQLVLSAYASPRNRLIPKKNVRVSSIGQQYVYRGIRPINKGSGSSEKSQARNELEFARTFQGEDSCEEPEEDWKQRMKELTDERDQALKERNQALAALMELEKEHAEALGTIERMRKEKTRSSVAENSLRTKRETVVNSVELSANHCKESLLEKLWERLGGAKSDFVTEKKMECDRDNSDHSLLKEIVTQANEERDNLLKRLTEVKTERNSYLERIHLLEKENQRLRDAVDFQHTDVSQHRLLDDISRHLQTSCHGENDPKEALSSVLAHLKSKRKQVTPSRLSKSPRLDHGNSRNSSEDPATHPVTYTLSSEIRDNGTTFSGDLGASNDEFLKERSEGLVNGNVDNKESNASTKQPDIEQDFLVFTSGSEMVEFSRHPLED